MAKRKKVSECMRGVGTVRLRGATWHIRWTDADGIRREERASSDLSVAKEILAERVRGRDRVRAGVLDPAEARPALMADLKDAYLADARNRLRPRSYARAEASINRILGVLQARTIRDISADGVSGFVASRLEGGASERTVSMDVGSLHTLIRWGIARRLVASDPLQWWRPLRQDQARKKRRALTHDEARRLLEAAEAADLEAQGQGHAPISQAALWRFILSTGTRSGEARSLRWADLDLEGRRATIRPEIAKGHRERAIPFSEELADALGGYRRAWSATRGREPEPLDLVFQTRDDRPLHVVRSLVLFKRTLKQAGIAFATEDGRTVDIHSLRVSYGSWLCGSGVPIRTVQLLLGHSTVELTAKSYCDPGLIDKRSAIEALPSLAGRVGITGGNGADSGQEQNRGLRRLA